MTMRRRVFFSFHYQADAWRAAQVRNMGVVEGDEPVSDNDWETVTRGGDRAIQRWIDGQMYGKSCAVVLIGSSTAGRKWIKYEIEKAWKDRKGLLGIYIHNLQDEYGHQSVRGGNPFADFSFGERNFSSVVNVYDPPYALSTRVYAYIANNIADWVEEAIRTRGRY